MKRFTIWREQGGTFCIQGTYSGEDEDEALAALAKDEGFSSFKECNAAKGLVRDNYRVKEVAPDPTIQKIK